VLHLVFRWSLVNGNILGNAVFDGLDKVMVSDLKSGESRAQMFEVIVSSSLITFSCGGWEFWEINFSKEATYNSLALIVPVRVGVPCFRSVPVRPLGKKGFGDSVKCDGVAGFGIIHCIAV